MTFETIPYPAKEADAWQALGREIKDYYEQLDRISDLMVAGTGNAHISDSILAAEGINQYMSGHSCDVSCLLPMADLAEKLGGAVLASKARSAQKTIKANSGWTHQEIDNFIHDALLVLSEEEIAARTQATAQSPHLFEASFAKWLESDFPREEVDNIDTYLSDTWRQVKKAHPEIWRTQQVGSLGPRLDGEAAFALLNQCGFEGALKVRRAKPAVAAMSPVQLLWIETVEGREVVIVNFADAMSLLDVSSWSELASTPSSPPRNSRTEWLLSQKKQFMIDRDSLSITEPKFLRRLPRKLIYLN